MRVLFMGSPLEVISVVEKLQLLQQHGDIELVAVVSQLHQSQRGLSEVESPVSLFAKAQRITCYQPRKASALVFMEKLRDLQTGRNFDRRLWANPDHRISRHPKACGNQHSPLAVAALARCGTCGRRSAGRCNY